MVAAEREAKTAIAKKRGRKKSPGHDQKLELILTESARLFCDKGYDVTSLEDIAAVVGMHKATLYHYVKSKEEILYHCLLRSFANLDEVEAQMKDRQVPVLDRLRHFFRTLIVVQASDFGRCNAVVGTDRLGPETGPRVREFQRRLNQTVIMVIEEGVEAGVVRPCNPFVATAMLFGAFNWVPLWYERRREQRVEDIGEQFLDLMINGLAAHPS